MEKALNWEQVNAHCETLTEDEDELSREIVTRMADKWTLWTMSVLAETGEPMRFSRVMEKVEGVSQKSLTKTLRQLERDGMVTRTVFAEVPPRVEYGITSLGLELLSHVEPLWNWVAKSIACFLKARREFDGR